MQYILLHKNAGWLTSSGIYHSDHRQALRVTEIEARDYIKLHSGKLVPVPFELYDEILRGIKQ